MQFRSEIRVNQYTQCPYYIEMVNVHLRTEHRRAVQHLYFNFFVDRLQQSVQCKHARMQLRATFASKV